MYYNLTRLFRSPEEDNGGIEPEKPPIRSMMEIEEAARKKAADPNYKEPEKVKEPAEPDPNAIPEGKMKDAAGNIVDDPNYKKPEVDPNKEPEIPAGKKLDVDGKTLIDDPDYVAPEEEAVNFWEEVEKRTGKAVKVEYPEGVEADTVEGAVIRETAVREDAIAEWEEDLKKRAPRAFAYMMHHMDGGSDEEFLGGDKGIALPTRELVEGSVEMQTQLFKSDLLNKGVDPEVVEAALAGAIKKNELSTKALKLYDTIQAAQAQQLVEVQARKAAEDLRVNTVIKNTTNKLEKVLPELGFILAETDKKPLLDFVLDNIEYDKRNDRFMIVQPLDLENPKAQIESLFFQFKKGDLSKIVAKKVATEAAQKLKLQADKSKIKLPIGNNDNKQQKQFVALGNMGPKKV